MVMVHHELILRGPNVQAGHPRPEAIAQVLWFVGPAVQESVCMRFRNTSVIRGRRPEWFRRSVDVRFVDVTAGPDDSTVLHFEAPRFGEAAEELYKQKPLFEDVRPKQEDTGFDLFADVLADIRKKAEDSLRFDAKLLGQVSKFKRYPSKRGVESIAISGDRLQEHPAILDEAVSLLAEELSRATPPPCRGRIAGKLDMIRDHDNVFKLMLGQTKTVRGVWTRQDMSTLRDLFGKDVAVEGEAVFRASGNLLRIDADAIRPATDADNYFRTLPLPVRRANVPRAFLRPQTSSAGAAAAFGKWPGDESERELLAVLEEMG